MVLGDKVSYEYHINFVLNRVKKIIDFLCRFQQNLPWQTYLDPGDIIYDWAFKESCYENLESIQCNASIAITGVIRDTTFEKLFQELGLESLKQWHHLKNLFLSQSFSKKISLTIAPANSAKPKTRVC